MFHKVNNRYIIKSIPDVQKDDKSTLYFETLFTELVPPMMTTTRQSKRKAKMTSGRTSTRRSKKSAMTNNV